MLGCYSTKVESEPETVIERLEERQDQPWGAQVHAIHLSDWEGRSQDAPLPRAPLRVGRGEVRVFHAGDACLPEAF